MTLPAGSNVELCYFVRVPATAAFMLGSWTMTHVGAKGATLPQHGLAYVYTGERLGEFQSGALVESRGCLDFGSADRDRRVLFASSSARIVTRTMPAGVAVELAPVADAPGGSPAGIGLLLDVNWENGDTRARTVASKLVLRRPPKSHVARVARPVSDRTAEVGIFVPPFTQHSTAELVDARWSPTGDVCVLGLSGQMHRRGRCLGIEQLDVSGQVKPPASGIPNPCEPDRRVELFAGLDFTDPGALGFTTPIPVRAGEALRYACTVDNGVTTLVRLGCEATPGTTPGSVAGGPAPLCTLGVPASAECGGAACVPANAVAGPMEEDEVCGLTALVYDAAPGGGCDVGSLP
jgi:hypothetical protein